MKKISRILEVMPDIRDVVEEAVNYQEHQHRGAEPDKKSEVPAVKPVSPSLQRLQQTIIGLEKGIASGGDFIKHVRYPKALVKALKELEMLIGNDELKGDIADGVNNIIMNKLLHEQNPNIQLENSMLNIALYGPPGVGKTTIGAKLAKIVYTLGYLNDRPKDDEGNALGNLFNNQQEEESAGWITMVVVIFYVVMIALALISTCRSAFADMSWIGIITIMVGLLVLVAFIAYIFWPSQSSKGKKNPRHNVDLKINKDDKKADASAGDAASPNAAETKKDDIEIEIPDDELITVVTRTDLVSRYVGNSDKDTLEVLQRNMGKVLFIDEAYQLYDNGSYGGDKFGQEVLNVINQFLSEHPKDIVIIFAGYKDKMYDTIFKAQPGLERRVMWHFECKGYTGEELYQILEFMCKQKGWTFRNPMEVEELIVGYADIFRNYGGDMDKVGIFARSAYNSDMIDPTVKDKPVAGILETRHILRAIKKFRENADNAAGGKAAQARDHTPEISQEQLDIMMNLLKHSQNEVKLS